MHICRQGNTVVSLSIERQMTHIRSSSCSFALPTASPCIKLRDSTSSLEIFEMPSGKGHDVLALEVLIELPIAQDGLSPDRYYHSLPFKHACIVLSDNFKSRADMQFC